MKKKDDAVVVQLEDMVVRYSNRFMTFDMATLPPVAQNLMALCFVYFRMTNKSTIQIPYTDIRRILGLTREKDSYLEDVVIRSVKDVIFNQPRFTFNTDKWVGGCAQLITTFAANKEERCLTVSLNEGLMIIFKDLLKQSSYAEFPLLVFVKIKSKWSKNLYRMFRRYFHGVCTLQIEEVRCWMGLSEKISNREAIRLVKKAMAGLIEQGVIGDSYVIAPHYSGKKLTSVTLEFSFADDETASLEEVKKENDLLLGIGDEENSKKSGSTKKEICNKENTAPFGVVDEDRFSEDCQIFIKKFCEQIGPRLKNDDPEVIEKLIKKHGLPDCLKAIEISVGNDVRSLNYIKTVLENMEIKNRNNPRTYISGPYADREIVDDFKIPF